MIVLETPRLILRTLENSDYDAMLSINRDEQVMRYFPGIQDVEKTKLLIEKIQAHFSEHGFSLYAVVLKENDEFIGFTGLLTATFEAPFTPAVEIGWRLASSHWGKGYATEAAKAVLDYAFNTLKLNEVVSFTTVNNTPSRRVMEKIGLTHNPDDDFIHQAIPEEYAELKPHVLYRLKRESYLG